jgi:protein-S-isoprenylcysteine O-methyltransferase Ste14
MQGSSSPAATVNLCKLSLLPELALEIETVKMMWLSWWQLVKVAWIVFACYWVISARNSKRSTQKEGGLPRLLHMLLMVIAYTLLFSREFPFALLNQRFLPNQTWLKLAGTLLTWFGVAGAIWARIHIGEYWSARITLKEDHQLIQTGPYRYVRHPIYTGLLLATIGTAIVQGELSGWVGVFMVLLLHFRKARKEELLLATQFGPSYEEYRRRTGFLIPRFH